jgi:hypothetical protein
VLPSIVVKRWVYSCLSWVVGLLWVVGFCLVFGRSTLVVVGCNESGLRRWSGCRTNGGASFWHAAFFFPYKIDIYLYINIYIYIYIYNKAKSSVI